MTPTACDVIVVGAGPAGLSAALTLGRMRRRVFAVDTDEPAHAVSEGVHNYLTRDGTPPAELRAAGRAELSALDTVELRATGARAARRGDGGGFEVDLDDGSTHAARRLLLAHGMDYVLPDVPGVEELWGKRVFHCPYCHGWEVRDQPLAVLATGAKAVHQTLLLQSLTDDCVLVAGPGYELDDEQLRALGTVAARIRRGEVREVAPHQKGLVLRLADGGELVRAALFVQPAIELPNRLAVSLGAELTEGGTILTADDDTTTVPGLFAAGDPAEFVQSVSIAAASGLRAAYAINAELAREDCGAA